MPKDNELVAGVDISEELAVDIAWEMLELINNLTAISWPLIDLTNTITDDVRKSIDEGSMSVDSDNVIRYQETVMDASHKIVDVIEYLNPESGVTEPPSWWQPVDRDA